MSGRLVELSRALTTCLVLAACAREAPLACAPGNAGLILPAGFCAQVLADSVGSARHIAIAPNGDILVALRDSTGGVLVLRDTNGDGVADVRGTFGPPLANGLAFFDGHVYVGTYTAVIRLPWTDRSLAMGEPKVIVADLPRQSGHAAKFIAIANDGSLFINVGAPSNSCQEQDRSEGSRGMDPCPLLERSGGIWRFDARRPGQRLEAGVRRATGLRNVVALTVGPDGSTLWGVQHGRDLLAANWRKQLPVFTDQKGAENPAEELFQIDARVDFGWPYCYYDNDLKRKVLAPEYGGDGETEGRCATAGRPLVAFPAHWAPESMVFYTDSQFLVEYQGGAFVAFHGSWNRAPLPEAGFNVSFVPFAAGHRGGHTSLCPEDLQPQPVLGRQVRRCHVAGQAGGPSEPAPQFVHRRGWAYGDVACRRGRPTRSGSPGRQAVPPPVNGPGPGTRSTGHRRHTARRQGQRCVQANHRGRPDVRAVIGTLHVEPR